MIVGPSHKVIPKLVTLHECLKDIVARTDDASMLNYAHHMKEIRIMAQVGLAEVDKMAVEDAK
jgi:hypothetical protein